MRALGGLVDAQYTDRRYRSRALAGSTSYVVELNIESTDNNNSIEFSSNTCIHVPRGSLKRRNTLCPPTTNHHANKLQLKKTYIVRVQLESAESEYLKTKYRFWF